MMFMFIEISKKQSHEHSPPITFIRLFTLPYKRLGKAGVCVSEIPSVDV